MTCKENFIKLKEEKEEEEFQECLFCNPLLVVNFLSVSKISLSISLSVFKKCNELNFLIIFFETKEFIELEFIL